MAVSPTTFSQFWSPLIHANWLQKLDTYCDVAFGERGSVFNQQLKTLLQERIKNGGNASCLKEVAKEAWKNSASNSSFFKRTWDMARPKGWATDFSAFKGAGNGILKSTGKTFAKRIPLIGTIIAVAFEIPNIIRSFTHKDGGVGTGLLETGKAGVRLGATMGGFAAGAAVGATIGSVLPIAGTAVGGVVGGIIGFGCGIIGSILGDKVAEGVLGKSFTQKQEEKAKMAQFGQGQMQGGQSLNDMLAQYAQAQQGLNQNPNLNFNYAQNPFARGNQNFVPLAQIYQQYMMMQQALAAQSAMGGNNFGYCC